MPTWSNWSGSVTSAPISIETPATEDDLRAIVRRAANESLDVRVVGTGHSFMPVAATAGILVSLDSMQGLVGADPPSGLATLWGGTKLHHATHLLWECGLGLANQGDVDVQSVAGAIGTGTHGTGPSYGNIPSRVSAMRLVTATGDILEVSRQSNPHLLRAARVSLGMLGITSQVTIECLPRYALHERVWQSPIEECLDELEANVAANDHYEFFWFPRSDVAESKSLNPVADQPVDEEPPPLEGPGERVGWSHRIFPSTRELRFNEMEYSVPAEEGPACFRAVRARMQEHHTRVVWPVEYRTVAADDAMLSPAYQRDTVTISIHQDAQRPYQDFFADIEQVFVEHGGRPHWGKIHNRSRDHLRQLYPEWDAFLAIRREFDPHGRFLNAHLRSLFS